MTSKGHHLVDAYWLEMGALRERERIISLIESEANNHGNPNAVNMLLSLIALINKECQKDNETVVFLTEGENK